VGQKQPRLSENRIASLALGPLAGVLAVTLVLYLLWIIESGAPLLTLGFGGLAAIAIALRAYGRKR
jgi:hypothetical protein